ncbi:MAG: GGDEF domain-containing protein [Devosia sp.]|uniref:GGDEF domain-containing protein n=1 Tax=Devosia sp. TaxID=1871048 RepID=UPI0024C56DBD|nr:GGDEF domain-containing protein [Devosia sp.]UYO00288.1 MAG: GGDEF domain-containing protein [Devosia sp.]
MLGKSLLSLLNPIMLFGFACLFALIGMKWHRRAYLWPVIAAFTLLGLAFLCQEFVTPRFDAAGRLISNGLFFPAVAAICAAILMRMNVVVPWRLFLGVILAGVPPFLWFLFIDADVQARVVISGCVVGSLALVTLAKATAARPERAMERILVACVLIGVLVAIGRPALMVVGLLDVNEDGSLLASDYWASVRGLSPILIAVIATAFLAGIALEIIGTAQREARTDLLTGLSNRRGFEGTVRPWLEASSPGTQPALILADIDNFKSINDRFGHKAGDRAISIVGKVMDNLGGADCAGRIGGEEFALFYRHATQRDLADRAMAIQDALARLGLPELPAGHRLTLSMGIHLAADYERLPDMMEQADAALYRAKADGKNRIVATPLSAHGSSPDRDRA